MDIRVPSSVSRAAALGVIEGDGIDDSVAINKAISHLAAISSGGYGGRVLLDAGGYVIKNPIKMKGGITLRGAGMKASVISLAPNSRCDMIQFDTPFDVEGNATGGSHITLAVGNSPGLVPSAHVGKTVRIRTGMACGAYGTISANTANSITLSAMWSGAFDAIAATTDTLAKSADQTTYFTLTKTGGARSFDDSDVGKYIVSSGLAYVIRSKVSTSAVTVYAGSNTYAGFTDGQTFTINSVPDATSRFIIGESTDLFQAYEEFTLYGRNGTHNGGVASGNEEVTGPADQGTLTITRNGLTDTAASFPLDIGGRATVEVWVDTQSGTLTGVTHDWVYPQVRRIRAVTATTLEFDDALKVLPVGGTSGGAVKYRIYYNGIALYGPGAYDVQFDRCWPSFCTGNGVFAEQSWGMVGNDLISEYNHRHGVLIELNAKQQASASPAEGPKFVNCKLVRNDGCGVQCGPNIYGSQFVGCEMAGGIDTTYLPVAGVLLAGNRGSIISGCKFASHGGITSAAAAASNRNGVRLGWRANIHQATGVVVNGCQFRSTVSGWCPVGLHLAEATSCACTGNVFNMTSTDVPFTDALGKSVIEGNEAFGVTYYESTQTILSSKTLTAGKYTVNPALGNPAPTSGGYKTVIQATVVPNDPQTAAFGLSIDRATLAYNVVDVWAGDAITTNAVATGGTASGQKVVNCTTTAQLRVGGTVNIAAGGSTAEDVVIAIINSATQFTTVANLSYTHAVAAAITPLFNFTVNAKYVDRNRVGS